MEQTVVLGKGLGKIEFGMTKSQIEDVLGVPNEIEKFAFGAEEDENTEAWHYDAMDLSLSFDEDEDWALTTITSSSEELNIKGKTLIGLEKGELLNWLKTENIGDVEEGEFDPEELDQDQTMSFYAIDDKNITFWIDEGEVSEIQWGLFIDEEGDYIWPNSEEE